ncbi:hypothetical protein P799_17475 [Lysinibacillus sphaericus CBAM5]|uniref:Uncharacterized protein n=1 Tax=Lysinibacillus sphaericus CBAM5 TaxID=1400869 RepID=W7S5G4_LYSSH|nr:hypothetical protein P799_17475 [Lysinibacillus sphaericus CBAM5]
MINPLTLGEPIRKNGSDLTTIIAFHRNKA